LGEIMNETKSPNLIIRQYKEGDEGGIVEVFNSIRSLNSTRSSVKDWIWAYKSHPNFDPELIYVAEEDGKIVGCYHAIVQDLKLDKSFLRMAFGSDLAILLSHRGSRIVLNLYDLLNKTLVEKGAVLKVGFTTPEHVSGFYTKLFGYFNVPSITYVKALSNRGFKDRILEINNKLKKNESLCKELEKFNLVIQFRLRDIPSFLLRITNGEIFIEDGETNTPDMVISGDQRPVLTAMRKKNRGGNKTDLLKAILTGRVKISGWLGSTLKLYKLFRIIMRLRGDTALRFK